MRSRRRCRSSWSHDRGSALIESLVVGSIVFLVVMSAVASSIRITVIGNEADEAARAGAIHAARHDDPSAAVIVSETLFPGAKIRARRDATGVNVSVVAPVVVSHPAGTTVFQVTGDASMPLAPFRSDRG